MNSSSNANAAFCGIQAEFEGVDVVLQFGIELHDGTLIILYDHQRDTLNRAGKRGVGSVQTAVFGEEEVRVGKPVTNKVRLHQVVTQLQGTDDMSGAPGNEDPTDNRGCRTVELPNKES